MYVYIYIYTYIHIHICIYVYYIYIYIYIVSVCPQGRAHSGEHVNAADSCKKHNFKNFTI